MSYDPHHDSIIESLKEIFARCSELEDRLEFLVNELEAHADYSDYATGDRREMANILEAYRVEFSIGKVRVPNVVRVKDGKAVGSYRHPKQYCVAYQEGMPGCPDCYDFICDACGEYKEGEPKEVVNTETVAGVVICQNCHTQTMPPEHSPECRWHKDWHACDCGALDDEEGYVPWSCDTCRPIMLSGGNTPERVEEQIEWLEKKIAENKKNKK